MARTSVQKLRQRKDKDGNPIVKYCDVCGKPLVVGEHYKSVWNYYNSWDVHIECYNKSPRSRWETSEYRGQVYDIIDNFTIDDIESTISDIENLRDETQDKLDNMPEQLQSSNSGEILQERIDTLDSVISDLETLRDEYDEIQNREKEEDEDIDEFEDTKQSDLEDKESEIIDKISEIDC